MFELVPINFGGVGGGAASSRSPSRRDIEVLACIELKHISTTTIVEELLA